MEILAQLLVLLIFTRMLGEGAERVGLPATVGELIAGIFLAGMISLFGSQIPFLHGMATSPALAHVANTGIFFLVLLAGIEMQPQEIIRHSTRSLMVAAGGAFLPLICGFAVAWLFLPDSDLKSGQALLVGIAMAITAIPVTVKVLGEFNLLHSRLGETIVAAAIFDDVIGLFLLAVLTAVIQTGDVPGISSFAILLGKVVLFFAVAIGLGFHVYPRISARMKELKAASLEFTALMVVALAYALFAELLGIHWILGAFVAGLYFEPTRVGETAYKEITLIVHGVTTGFLAPLFLASIGFRVDLSAIAAIPGFLGLLIAIAFLGKFFGAGIPALIAGLNRREAVAVGVGMSARGAVELIILSIAAEAGLFDGGDHSNPLVANLFSALVIVAVVTTVITPILMRLVLSGERKCDR